MIKLDQAGALRSDGKKSPYLIPVIIQIKAMNRFTDIVAKVSKGYLGTF